MKNEDGFHFNEYPCASGKPDALVVFLHGYGNHPDMFKDLPPEIQKRYPNADILVVRGPVPLNATQAHKDRCGTPDVDDLYTWYKSTKSPDETFDLAISHLFNRVPVVDQLNKFADAQLEKRGLKDDKLVLFGFSLGGAMVVQMGTRRDKECAAIINHSGPVLPIIAPKSKPDTLFLMGDDDHYFYTSSRTVKNPNPPPKPKKMHERGLKKLFDTALSQISVHYNASLMRLKRAGMNTKGIVIKGMTHTINEESFTHSIDFMVEHLKKTPPAPPPPAPPAPSAPTL